MKYYLKIRTSGNRTSGDRTSGGPPVLELQRHCLESRLIMPIDIDSVVKGVHLDRKEMQAGTPQRVHVSISRDFFQFFRFLSLILTERHSW